MNFDLLEASNTHYFRRSALKSLLIGKFHLLVAVLTCMLLSNCKMSAWKTDTYGPGLVIGENDIERVADVDPDTLPVAREIFDAASLSAPMLIVLHDAEEKRLTVANCSGLLVEGEGSLPRVLTNRHCFLGPKEQKVSPATCARTFVYFDKVGTKQQSAHIPKIERKCKSGSLRTSLEGDLAVFTLNASLPPNYAYAKIWEDNKISVSHSAFAIHYPDDPKAGVGKVKITGQFEIPLPASKIPALPKSLTIRNCRLQRRAPFEQKFVKKLIALGFPKDLAVSLPYKAPYAMLHACDLTGGSSGAALYDVKTGKVLALHFGMVAFIVSQSGREAIFAGNAATQAMHVRQFLNGEKVALP